MSEHNCAIAKDYVPASFKGVGFNCTEVDIEGGRRGAEGEFPFGEITAYADLGRKIQVYHLTAVFRADDHVFDSHSLFQACQSPGPGVLVHPTRGGREGLPRYRPCSSRNRSISRRSRLVGRPFSS